MCCWGAKVGAQPQETFWASQKAALGQRPVAGWALRLVTPVVGGPRKSEAYVIITVA